jgi:hypothetical protein
MEVAAETAASEEGGVRQGHRNDVFSEGHVGNAGVRRAFANAANARTFTIRFPCEIRSFRVALSKGSP